MIIQLPNDIAKNIPAGHTFHRWTGNVEYVQTRPSGQRNFFLHPIAGEGDTALESADGYALVTDLQIEQLNGHPIVLFGFLSPKYYTGYCFAYSRNSGAWLTLNDTFKLSHLFDTTNAAPVSKLFSAFVKTIAGPNSSVVYPINPSTGKPMNSQEQHQLILRIRQYITTQMNQPSSGSDRL